MFNYLVLYNNLIRHFSFINSAGIIGSLIFLRNRIHIISRKRVILIRKGTKDRETFDEIFKDNLYGILLPFYPVKIIDAGANTGIASIFFKTKYRDAKIVAVEIENSNIAMLRKNLLGPDFVIYQRAIYNKKAFFKIEDPFKASNSFVIKEVDANLPYDVEAITIDEIIATQNWENVDILKIDIEGAEKMLFQSGYQSWLPKVKVFMIETHDRLIPDCTFTVLKAMREFDYTLYTTTQGTLIFYSREVMDLHN